MSVYIFICLEKYAIMMIEVLKGGDFTKNPVTKKRIAYALAFVTLVVIEVLIALFVRDSFVRPYGGDIIVIAVLYAFVRIFIPQKLKLLPLYLFAFAVFVECAQAVDYVSLLGLSEIKFFKILLGTSFSWYDVACYGAGSIICAFVQTLTFKIEKKKAS